jgi:hypothetical protein
VTALWHTLRTSEQWLVLPVDRGSARALSIRPDGAFFATVNG